MRTTVVMKNASGRFVDLRAYNVFSVTTNIKLNRITINLDNTKDSSVSKNSFKGYDLSTKPHQIIVENAESVYNFAF